MTPSKLGSSAGRRLCVTAGVCLLGVISEIPGRQVITCIAEPVHASYERTARYASLNRLPDDSFIKVQGRRAIADKRFQHPESKPAWFLLNHGHRSVANCEMFLSRAYSTDGSATIAWRTVRLVAANEELRFPYGGYVPAAWNHDRVIRRTSSFDDDVRGIGAARRKRPRSLYSPP